MNNDMKNSYTSRTEKRKLEDLKNSIRENELEKNRKELKEIIFDDDVPLIKKKKSKKKNPVFTNILLSFTMVLTIGFAGYLIYDSTNRIDQMYMVINACFILITVICFLISFKRTYLYHKTKASAVTALMIVILIVFNSLYFLNIINLPKQSYVPDFTKKSMVNAIKWAEANGVSYNQNLEYTDSIKKYSVINQSIKPKILTRKIKKINFDVSNGPDYNKEVIITNMTGWNIDDAVKVIKKNRLNNVHVSFKENNEIKRDTIINQDKSGTIKRSDDVNIEVSLGDINKLGEIKFKSLVNLNIFDATLYLNRNLIDYELKYDFSSKIEKGNVISCSIKQGKMVNPGDKVILTISKGKKIIVPELKNMKMSKVISWFIKNNLKMQYIDEYSNSVKKGDIISASYKKGDVIEEETTIGITVSKGKLKMPKFHSLAEFKTWADKYGIKYKQEEEFNDEVKLGDIIRFSQKENKVIDTSKSIVVYISKGKAITVPDFMNKTKYEADKICSNKNLKCSYIYSLDNSKNENTIIGQSINAGREISINDNILLKLTTKMENKVTKSASNNSYQKSNKTNNNSYSAPVNNCNKTTTIYLYDELYDLHNASRTCSSIKETYRNVKFNCVYGDYGYSTGIVVNSGEIDEKVFNNCQSVTLKINK